nr:MAG TPA: activating signal cointegrator [Bacteriophage sp.]
MTNTLKLVLTDHWFEEIKSGRKKYEYRKATPYWEKRLGWHSFREWIPYVQFQKAYRKNPERMTFEIYHIERINGLDTDLHCDEDVFAIKLGERIK